MAGRDAFKIHVNQKQKPVSRRGILATVSSVFDPLGLVSPFVLRGRLLLRDLCRIGLDWDDPVPEAAETAWADWIQDMTSLQGIEIPRCYSPGGLHSATKIELHHFSDASAYWYGQCSYVRTVDDEGHGCSTLAISKCRVAPSKPITIPRLELMAAELSVKASVFLREELKIPDITENFWTSRVVLGYHRILLDTSLVIDHYHRATCHGGRGMTLGRIRSSGYWIIPQDTQGPSACKERESSIRQSRIDESIDDPGTSRS